jgi:hypothetical protein
VLRIPHVFSVGGGRHIDFGDRGVVSGLVGMTDLLSRGLEWDFPDAAWGNPGSANDAGKLPTAALTDTLGDRTPKR